MKSNKLESINNAKFVCLDDDMQSLCIAGQGTGLITHVGTGLPNRHDIGTDMISDV